MMILIASSLAKNLALVMVKQWQFTTTKCIFLEETDILWLSMIYINSTFQRASKVLSYTSI